MPAATHRLHDVVPYAVSLVKRGANGQAFFLRKSTGVVLSASEVGGDLADVEMLVPLPRSADLIAKSDWSAVYCVVASPTAVENGGLLDPTVWDQWESPEEIRKAAHAFMANGALVTKMHEDLAPYGTIVENAIALVDLEVEGQTIAKGSWYVAIAPTDEGKEAIESGDFTGVSIEGTGQRTEIEKADPRAQGTKGKDRAGASSAQTCPGCRGKVTKGAKTCQNCGHKLSGATNTNVKKKVSASLPLTNKPDKTNYIEQGGGLPKLIRDLAEKQKAGPPVRTDSQAIRLAIGIAENFAEGHNGQGNKISAEKQAKWAAAVAEYKALPAKAAARRSLKKETSMSSKLMTAIAKTLGIDPDDPELTEPLDDDVEEIDLVKANAVATFAQRIAAREIEDDLPLAFDALRGAVYDAVYPFAYGYSDPPTPAAARAALDESLQQFHDHLLTVFDNVTGDNIAKSTEELQADLATLGSNQATASGADEEDADMGDTATPSKIEKLESDVAEVKTAVADLVKGLQPVIDRVKEQAAPTPEQLATGIADLAKGLETLTKGVERLGAGDSSQLGDDQPVKKSTDPLAGLLD